MSEAEIVKLGGLLGLARKAGRIIMGADNVVDFIQRGKSCYVLLTSNASPRTRKRISDICAEYGRECTESQMQMRELSHYIGAAGDTSAVAVTDTNFIEAIKKLIGNNTEIEKLRDTEV